MKSILISLLAVSLLAGCKPQSKRLADERNTEYQKKLNAKNAKNSGKTTSTTTQSTPPVYFEKNEAEELEAKTQTEEKKDATSSQSSAPAAQSPMSVPTVPTVPTVPAQTAQPSSPAQKPAEEKAASSTNKINVPAPKSQPAQAPAAQPSQAQPKQASAPAANPAPAAKTETAAPAQASTQTVSSNTDESGPEFLNLQEYRFIVNIMSQNFGEDLKSVITDVNSQGFSVQISGKESKVSAQLLNGVKIISEIKDLTLNVGDIVKMDSNDYTFIAACLDNKCQYIFFNYAQLEENGNYKFNVHGFIKTVEGQYVLAKQKSIETYKKEFEELKAKQASQNNQQ